MPVNDVYETILTWRNITRRDRYVNVLHWKCSVTDAITSDEEGITTKVQSLFATNVLPTLSTFIALERVLTQRVYPLPRTAGFYIDHGDADIGTQVGDMLPPACAVVMRKRTPLAGRAFRGRMFVVGMVEADQVNGVWSGANWNAMAIAVGTIISSGLASAGGGSYIPGIGPKAITDDNFVPVTSYFADPVVRSQRRREVGVGF